MKRRDMLTGWGAVLAAPILAPKPLAAQTGRPPKIGFLHSGSFQENESRVAAFLKGLSAGGFVDGRNVSILFRWGEGHDERLVGYARELIANGVAVMVTPASAVATTAAKAATSAIPIVFATGIDPASMGWVASLSHPGGNITGINSLNVELVAKRFALLRELVPSAWRIFALANSGSPLTGIFFKEAAASGERLGVPVVFLKASNDEELRAVFAALPEGPQQAMAVNSDAFFYTRRALIAGEAARRGVPAVFDNREFVDAGGLISYGADWTTLLELAGGYTARILMGEKPADLPVIQSTKYECALNLGVAKSLGLEVSAAVLALADQVVE